MCPSTGEPNLIPTPVFPTIRKGKWGCSMMFCISRIADLNLRLRSKVSTTTYWVNDYSKAHTWSWLKRHHRKLRIEALSSWTFANVTLIIWCSTLWSPQATILDWYKLITATGVPYVRWLYLSLYFRRKDLQLKRYSYVQYKQLLEIALRPVINIYIYTGRKGLRVNEYRKVTS